MLTIIKKEILVIKKRNWKYRYTLMFRLRGILVLHYSYFVSDFSRDTGLQTNMVCEAIQYSQEHYAASHKGLTHIGGVQNFALHTWLETIWVRNVFLVQHLVITVSTHDQTPHKYVPHIVIQISWDEVMIDAQTLLFLNIDLSVIFFYPAI